MNGAKTIGASEIAAVLGLDRFTTPRALWERKTNRAPPFTGNPDTVRGKHLEASLCSWGLELSNGHRNERTWAPVGKVLDNGQLEVRHPSRTFARATPDLLAAIAPVRWPASEPLDPSRSHLLCCVDVKAPRSDRRKVPGGGYERVWSEEEQVAPIGYQAQVTYQVGVLRACGVPVVAGELWAGPFYGELARVAVPFDEALFALMLDRAEAFLDLVARDVPPPDDFAVNLAATQEQPNV